MYMTSQGVLMLYLFVSSAELYTEATPCAHQHQCSHYCQDSPGGVTCSCLPGFVVMKTDSLSCEAEPPEPLLLVSSRRNTSFYNLNDVRSTLPHLSYQWLTRNWLRWKITSIDFDSQLNIIFMSSSVTNTLHTLTGYRNDNWQNMAWEILKVDNVSIGGEISYDWINKNLYWADAGATIKYVNMDSKKIVALSEISIGDDPIVALCVDPRIKNSRLYWAQSTKIGQAYLNGASARIFQANKGMAITSIALDNVEDRMFVALYLENSQAYALRIMSIDVNGLNMGNNTILPGEYFNKISNLRLFENQVYWSESFIRGNSVRLVSMHRRDMNGSTAKTHLHETTEFHRLPFAILHPALQPMEDNLCLTQYTNYCSHFCYPQRETEDEEIPVICDCPAEMKLQQDNRTCQHFNSTTTSSRRNPSRVIAAVFGAIILVASLGFIITCVGYFIRLYILPVKRECFCPQEECLVLPYDFTEVFDEPHQASVMDEITPNNLHIEEKLGGGHFGDVYKGNLWDEDLGVFIQVAVKTMKLSLVEDHEAFLREAAVMRDLHHINVLQLKGVSRDSQGAPCIVLPLMHRQDLHSYISTQRQKINVLQLLKFCCQVSNGMKYLSVEKKIIHRDLAARNCLLDDNYVVKISDFGLSRRLYHVDGYPTKMNAVLPYRWMALEILEGRQFTPQADSWSFAVLAWEVFSHGALPYADVKDLNVYLQSGQRLERPKTCPVEMHYLMLECWDRVVKERPQFDEILLRLTSIVSRNIPLAETQV